METTTPTTAAQWPVRCSRTRMADPTTLVPSPDNANTHPPSQLELYRIILAAQGWRRPIVVSRLSGTITRGHGALLAALSGGQAQVPVEDQDYENPEMEKADRIADNRLASLSEIEDAKIAGRVGAGRL